MHRNEDASIGFWSSSARLPLAPCLLPERERKRLGASFEEFDLELSIADGLRLSDQLIHPLLRQGAVTALVHIGAVGSSWRAPIDEHTKWQGKPSRGWPHDEMKVASVKAVRDAPLRLVQHNGFFLHRPIARKPPVVELETCGDHIGATRVRYRSTERRKILGARMAQVVFR